MMACVGGNVARPCPRERAFVDSLATSPVGDDEYLCRAAYEMHFRSGKLQTSLIKAKDLAYGELSVWRLDPEDAGATNEVKRHLEEHAPLVRDGSRKQILKQLYAATAKSIRDLSDEVSLLIRLDNANRLAFAEKVQAGQMTQAEAEQAVLQARSQLTSEEQRRDSSNQIANAQMQAANAQRSMAISAAFSNIQAGMNASAARQPTNCVSSRMGNQVVTNCN